MIVYDAIFGRKFRLTERRMSEIDGHIHQYATKKEVARVLRELVKHPFPETFYIHLGRLPILSARRYRTSAERRYDGFRLGCVRFAGLDTDIIRRWAGVL